VAIPERTVRAMLATVRQAAFADDLPTTVVACLHDVVGADYVTYDDFGPDRTTSVADPIVPPEIEEAWTRFGHQTARDLTDEEVAVMELLRVELSLVVAARENRSSDPLGTAGLTVREQEVLGWLATGLRDREIARELGVSTRTVSKHLGAVYRKLGVTTRAAAVAVATGRAIPPGST
jgi:DNA-binding CsgD family transcriptional regulator